MWSNRERTRSDAVKSLWISTVGDIDTTHRIREGYMPLRERLAHEGIVCFVVWRMNLQSVLAANLTRRIGSQPGYSIVQATCPP